MEPTRKITESTVNLIKTFEGFRAHAYKDVGGLYTVGYGQQDGVTEGMQVTVFEADQMLRQKLARIAEEIAPIIRYECSENQFSALCSLVYNIGVRAFKRSSLLKKLNEGSLDEAADQFLRWSFVDGKQVPGLLRRRRIERRVFLGLETCL